MAKTTPKNRPRTRQRGRPKGRKGYQTDRKGSAEVKHPQTPAGEPKDSQRRGRRNPFPKRTSDRSSVPTVCSGDTARPSYGGGRKTSDKSPQREGEGREGSQGYKKERTHQKRPRFQRKAGRRVAEKSVFKTRRVTYLLHSKSQEKNDQTRGPELSRRCG